MSDLVLTLSACGVALLAVSGWAIVRPIDRIFIDSVLTIALVAIASIAVALVSSLVSS